MNKLRAWVWWLPISLLLSVVVAAQEFVPSEKPWRRFFDSKAGIELEYPSDWFLKKRLISSKTNFQFSNVKEVSEVSEDSLANESIYEVVIDPGTNPSLRTANQWLDDTIIKPGNYDFPPEQLTQVTLGNLPAVRFEAAGLLRMSYTYAARGTDIVSVGYEIRNKKFQNIYKRMMKSLILTPVPAAAPR